MVAIPRPGGRSARTKSAVFEAVATIVGERGHAAVTMTEVAERAGVAATSLYRRWGDVGALVMEVTVEQLMREHPLPDTGSLKGDLSAWARSIAAGLRRPEEASFFVALVATATPREQRGLGENRRAATPPRSNRHDAGTRRGARRKTAAGRRYPGSSAVAALRPRPVRRPRQRGTCRSSGAKAFAAGVMRACSSPPPLRGS